MSGQAHQAFDVGSRVMVDVGMANSPQGTWEAIVTSCEERGPLEKQYYLVEVKLDDARLGPLYNGGAPSVNYRVHPYSSKPYFARMDEMADGYKKEIADMKTREQALLDALKAIGSQEKVLAAIARVEQVVSLR